MNGAEGRDGDKAADRGLLSGAAECSGEKRFQSGGERKSRSAACGGAAIRLTCS